MLARETRIAINGFGRIGRALMRHIHSHPSLRVVHINDPMPASQAAYLLRFDSVMGRLFADVTAETAADGASTLNVMGKPITMTHRRDMRDFDWAAAGVDFVLNSSGANNDRASLESFLSHGAKRVFISAPAPKSADVHILMGVNNMALSREHRIISAGSCTAACFAPIIEMLSTEYRIERGYLQTVHAYTSSQNLTDGPPHEGDLRRGRAAASNIVPTTTEAIRAFESALPQYKDLLHGMAMRVPVMNGSNIDLILQLGRKTGTAAAPAGSTPPITRDEINAFIRLNTESRARKIVEYSEDPLVSSDIIGNPHSCIFDSLLTDVHGPLVRLFLWYDNEWGYTNRLAELLELASFLR